MGSAAGLISLHPGRGLARVPLDEIVADVSIEVEVPVVGSVIVVATVVIAVVIAVTPDSITTIVSADFASTVTI